MAETGMNSTDLPLVAALDEVIGNATLDGIRRTARQSMADHAEQIMADGPIADALAAEGAARAAADTALDGRLTPLEAANLPARMTAAEAELTDHETRIDNAESLITTGAKTPVAVSTLSTVNIPIATGVVNGANIGGFVVSTGQLVVLTGQTAPAENGAYPVVAAGATVRAAAFDTSAELLGAAFAPTNGALQGTVYAVRNTGAINVGVDAIVITHAYGTPGNPTQVEVTAARQGYVDVAANLTAMKAVSATLTERNTTGFAPVAAGSVTSSNLAFYFDPLTLSTGDEWIDKVTVAFNARKVITLAIAHVEAGGELTTIATYKVRPPAAGLVDITGLNIFKPAGSVLGVGAATGMYFTDGGAGTGFVSWSTTALPTTNTAKAIQNNRGMGFKAHMRSEVLHKARFADDAADLLLATIGSARTFGWPTPLLTTGTDTPANYTVIDPLPEPEDGYITHADLGADGPGTTSIIVATMNGDGTFNIVSSTDVTLINGVAPFDLRIRILAGQFKGVSGGGYKFQNGANPTGLDAYIRAGAITTNSAVTLSAQHRYEISLTVTSGLLAADGGTDKAGLALLDAADASGVADATALFAAARNNHPSPYIPPGKFALTSIPASGDGFWGSPLAKPFVNGERFFVPEKPSLLNLFDGFRAKMAEHIANNDVLCLIADSIGHWALASSGPKHWFNLVTRFANLGIAADEPGMTALRPSSTYTPDFYGVTASGTVSTGTRGPLGESIILAAGASLAFTGAYEQVDVHYTQDAGQGSLAFAFNGGAAYKSVNCAGGLVLDQYSGPSLTGQAASGNYTLTAVGGPVEITGLIRLGVKVAGSRPRLRTLRAAHGSYVFSSYNAARLASAVAQCGYAGGKIVPVLALGINDSFGTPPATISANIVSVINTLEAAAAPRIFVMPPTRPSSAWDGSYTGGRTYDAALGAIRQTYRSRNVLTIPIDGFDYINSGNYQEGLHYNDAGHDGNALRFVGHVAERG